MFDELMVAPPIAQKRHKRSIHQYKHILYKKSQMDQNAFHFDTVKGKKRFQQINYKFCTFRSFTF